MLDILLEHVQSLDLKPEQKTAVDGIEADLDKAFDAVKPAHRKFDDDLAEGAAAGKLDRAKTDADVRELVASVTSTLGVVQDAMNRLHKTLDAGQRKKVIEELKAHGKEMHEHGFGDHGFGEHEHGHDHDHAGGPGGSGPGAPPGAHAGGPGGPGPGAPPGAHAGGPGPGAPGPHAGGPGGPGGHAEWPGAWGEHGGPMLAKLGDELALTPEQREKLNVKLEAQGKADFAAMKARMPAVEKHLAAVGAAFESENFDAKKLGVGSQAPDMVKAMANGRIKFIESVLSVLTAEQRVKFAAHLREHAAKAAEG